MSVYKGEVGSKMSTWFMDATESYFIVCVGSPGIIYLLSFRLVPYSTGISLSPPLQASATFVETPIKKSKTKNFIFWPLEK